MADVSISASVDVHGFRVANSRDLRDHAVNLEQVGGVDVFSFPEIGVALMGGEAAASRGMTTMESVGPPGAPIS